MVVKRNGKGKRGSKASKGGKQKFSDVIIGGDSKIRSFVPRTFGFPLKLMTTLRYHTNMTLASTAGSVAQYGFRWNSIFDPDLTSTGHQPLYRDTFAGIYDHYAVVSARASIFVNNASTTIAQIAVSTDDDGSPTSTYDTFCEQNLGTRVLLGSINSGSNDFAFSLAWDCKKVLGIDPYASELYKTSVTANPDEQSVLWITNVAYESGSASVGCDVMIEYDVLFTELATATQS